VDETTKSFWNWHGRYVGYRASDCLFGCDGRQIGYFAEGDEVYGCAGGYIGEIRGDGRLITNLSKKAWTRRTVTPRVFKSSPGHRDVNPKEMLAGFTDFPAPPEHI
jgi:hypothetical protein